VIDASVTRLSVLDVVLGTTGGTAQESFNETLETARLAERLGYHRYWLAEHHGGSISLSSATAVLIGAVAAATTEIRVGSGGVMLPNHPALRIAEDYGTLDNLYPGRIDLGLGRGVGGSDRVKTLLRGDRPDEPADFANQVAELAGYFGASADVQVDVAAGRRPPIWLLGSGLGGARLAARRGLPFAYAHHIFPDNLEAAVQLYRAEFRPSDALAEPYVLVSTGVLCADTDADAARLRGPVREMLHQLGMRSTPPLLTPEAAAAASHGRLPGQRATVEAAAARYFVGSAPAVGVHLADLRDRSGADELMVQAIAHDAVDRRRSLELLALAAGLGTRR